MLPELAGHIFVRRILARQFQRDGHQVEAIHRHPAGAVGLFDEAAAGQRLAAVEDADVVEPQKSALKDVLALRVLAVHPPGEVQQQLVEDALQELAVGLAAALGFNLVDAPGGPGMHRRIDVAEVPLVGRQLPVRVHIPLAQHQHELLFGEFGIDQRQRQAVEAQVPGGVPRIFPFIRHGDHVGVVQVHPLVVAAELARGRRAAASRGRRSASRAPRSGRTAWTTAGPRRPGASRAPASAESWRGVTEA